MDSNLKNSSTWQVRWCYWIEDQAVPIEACSSHLGKWNQTNHVTQVLWDNAKELRARSTLARDCELPHENTMPEGHPQPKGWKAIFRSLHRWGLILGDFQFNASVKSFCALGSFHCHQDSIHLIFAGLLGVFESDFWHVFSLLEYFLGFNKSESLH